MKPIVAIVGRPNVGKSTIFNRLIGERKAIVEDIPGTTRDRLYADTDWNGREFILVDTGGVDLAGEDNFATHIHAQVQTAIEEADVIVFLTDAQTGITQPDTEVAEMLRKAKKPIVLGVNKADSAHQRYSAVEFYSLGLGEPIPFSSTQGTGTGDLLDAMVSCLPPADEEAVEEMDMPRIAIVGRPNVGKSSLLNAILGQERSIVSDIPGTTRDAIDTVITHSEQQIMLIDTAGIRRRGHINVGTEKFSVLRAHRAIDRADVVLLVVDAEEGLTAQDTHIAGYIHEATKGLLVIVNKWDLIKAKRDTLREEGTAEEQLPSIDKYQDIIRNGLKFAPYASVHFTSAKTGFRVKDILDEALRINQQRQKRIPTGKLNEVIHNAVTAHPPSPIKGRKLKVFYATQPEISPPRFILFVNDNKLLHFSYERYLENQLRKAFDFEGTAIKINFRPKAEKE